MPLPTNSQYVARVMKVSKDDVVKFYLTVFMAFEQANPTMTLARVMPNAADGTPRFTLTYESGQGAAVWTPLQKLAESDPPVADRVIINGLPVIIEQSPDDLVP